jgi:hypothetical protein
MIDGLKFQGRDGEAGRLNHSGNDPKPQAAGHCPACAWSVIGVTSPARPAFPRGRAGVDDNQIDPLHGDFH